MGVLDQRFEKNFMISSVDYVFNWARKSAIWPLTFGLACCAIEMIASTTARFDIARFGAEVFRPSPRQADLMIVAGTVTLKMGPVLRRVWEQMPDPKWCISMGACSSVGGPFNAYSVLQGVDRIVPVDVYVIGCPPRPEGLFYALLKLQDKIDQMSLAKRPTEVRLQPDMVEQFRPDPGYLQRGRNFLRHSQYLPASWRTARRRRAEGQSGHLPLARLAIRREHRQSRP